MSSELRSLYLFYFFIYMNPAVYGTFAPVYFEQAGFSHTQIGILLGAGPLAAILAQPLWGTVSDRAPTKNRVLLLLLAGCALCMAVFPLSVNFLYVLAMICLFMFFQNPAYAIGDAVTLEILDKNGYGSGNFSLIRMAGTVGFALMSVAFGWMAREQIEWMFPVNAAIFVICILLVLRMPPVAGHQVSGRKMNMIVLFRHRKLMLYMSICFILQMTLGFYYTFYPVYAVELGANSAWIGGSMLVSSLSEVPFLLFSAYVFRKIRIPYILLAAGAAAALRWFLFSVIENPVWIFPIQLLHGLIFIVISVTMAIFINREVPDELKASGQTLHALLCMGIARIIGSFLGGMAGDAFGLKQVFFYNALVAAACVVVFSVIFRRLGETRADHSMGRGTAI